VASSSTRHVLAGGSESSQEMTWTAPDQPTITSAVRRHIHAHTAVNWTMVLTVMSQRASRVFQPRGSRPHSGTVGVQITAAALANKRNCTGNTGAHAGKRTVVCFSNEERTGTRMRRGRSAVHKSSHASRNSYHARNRKVFRCRRERTWHEAQECDSQESISRDRRTCT
jgi:hypothetical protein